ncbi:GNAT family N-acetyltransferase [Vibrio ulleungensis]|uniref:GNAT family N-acetyltransferase n=1 Tax=Vibrio ulleungensis TaxID=2807619 RepID=A0ABS2HGM6_9VIBR|nr:GNAT family N-acetyltransferase [Vibrio ulleungensis]MBM7036675.1 GNAT family N-acetyltransferase [Vibrio ulleungensis]
MDIVKAHHALEDAYVRYVNVCYAAGLDYYDIAIDDPKAFLSELIKHARGESLPDGWVRCSTYFCVEGGEIIGALRLRHQSNDFIDNVIGHIGYETHPQSRGRGVATAMLTHVRNKALEGQAFIICETTNKPSEAVMLRAGAVLDTTLVDADKGVELLRYKLSATT